MSSIEEPVEATTADIEALAATQEDEEEALSVEELLDEAKRSYALRKWDEAVDNYGRLLEALSEEHPEDAPLLAPLHHRYGHALLEHAIATSGALGAGGGSKDAPMPSRQGAGGASTVAAARAQGKDAAADQKAGKALKEAVQNNAQASGSSSSSTAAPGAVIGGSKQHDPRFTFGGDAEDSEDEEQREAGPSAPAEDGEEDEDDLGVAFSVLELARVRYEKILSEPDPMLKTIDGEDWDEKALKLQLAEVLNDLADVGLESENFQQAASDYQLALEMLQDLLQSHSRRLADANLRLGLALEFHPDADKQRTAESYVLAAVNTLRRRLDKLEEREKDVSSGKSLAQGVTVDNTSGASAAGVGRDDVAQMDWQAVAKEERDVADLIKELEMKVEEYKALPVPNGESTSSSASGNVDPKAALKQAINEALLGASTNGIAGDAGANGGDAASFSAAKPDVPVNDLSAMVKKKKRPVEEAATSADKGNAAASNTPAANGKRARVEEGEE